MLQTGTARIHTHLSHYSGFVHAGSRLARPPHCPVLRNGHCPLASKPGLGLHNSSTGKSIRGELRVRTKGVSKGERRPCVTHYYNNHVSCSMLCNTTCNGPLSLYFRCSALSIFDAKPLQQLLLRARKDGRFWQWELCCHHLM